MWRNFLEWGPAGRQRAWMREKKGGCRRSGAEKEQTEKVAAEGRGQKKWLRQRSLGRQIRETEEVF